MLLCLFIIFVFLTIMLIYLRSNSYITILYVKLCSIVLLTVVSILYVSKFSSYQFVSHSDFILYLQLRRITLHPYVINNIYIFLHVLYLSTAVMFLYVHYDVSLKMKLLSFLPIIYIYIVKFSAVSEEILWRLFTLPPQLQSTCWFIADILASKIIYVIILSYSLFPVAGMIISLLRTRNMIRKNFFLSYLICMLLVDIMYFSIFIHGTFKEIAPQQFGTSVFPENSSIHDNMFTLAVYIVSFTIIITTVLIYLKPFAVKRLDSNREYSKNFQKFQYDNYYTTMHALKNTMLSIYKYIEVSEKYIENEKALISLNCAKEQIDEQLETYNNTVAYFKTKHISFEKLNIIDVINDAVSSVAISDGITITKHYNENEIKETIGNYFGLFQAFTNIISNSVNSLKISQAAKKRIDICITDDKEYLIIDFKDNGDGIACENQKYIFNLFFSTHADKFCSGIGLYYAKNMIMQHKGNIWFKSNPSETTFTVVLPVIESKAEVKIHEH